MSSIVKDDTRRNIQLILAVILVASAIGYLGYYAVAHADAEFREQLANDFKVLVIMGIGAALAIFGLGRTVGKS